ncbi:MAG TPA: Smr/MutS family protein [Pseudolabrys sp.]|nr:Smr/MutS family protein [Pseudolabrys sp.]
MASRDGRRRTLSYDERVLWTTVTKSVAPMHGELPDEDDSARPPEQPAPKRVPRAPAPAAPSPAPVKAPPALQPLDRRTRQRVARGREQIDARIDLHGLTQAEAHAALSRFLHAASARGARLVLVITGKGGRGGDGERGVLRRQVPQWLALPDFRAFVIGFEDAHTAHGGEGAMYVRLRRRRGEAD